MPTITTHAVRAAAVAALVGSLALAHPAFAVITDESPSASPPSTTMNMDSNSSSTSSAPAASSHHMKHHHMMAPSPEKMKQDVEQRISTLHTKLKITPDQESEWNDVAQAMRDNETSISDAIQTRQAGAKTMTAVDDLESYQKIAQAHADGLKNVISAFSKLYDGMSDDQKANADKVFGSFEGHPDRKAKSM